MREIKDNKKRRQETNRFVWVCFGELGMRGGKSAEG